jgi:hypothetical protein
MDSLLSLSVSEATVFGAGMHGVEGSWHVPIGQSRRVAVVAGAVIHQKLGVLCELDSEKHRHTRKTISAARSAIHSDALVRADLSRARRRLVNGRQGVRSPVASVGFPLLASTNAVLKTARQIPSVFRRVF